jgi:nucleotide-binding universal stress UspA family protein
MTRSVSRIRNRQLFRFRPTRDAVPKLSQACDACGMFDNVLVPLDRSRNAEAALTVATALALNGSRRLTLVEVHRAREPAARHKHMSMGGMDVVIQDAPGAYLDRWAGAMRRAGFIVDPCHAVGDPASEILRAASTCEADVIVMTTHRRGALARAALGSIADAVARALPCPIVMVRPDQAGVRPPDVTGIGFEVRTVLIPLDGSAAAEAALGPLTALAHDQRLRVHLAHVVATPLSVEAAQRANADAAVYLGSVAKRLDRLNASVTVDVAQGSVPDALLRMIESVGADMVVMGTHGFGALRRLVRGSVTTALLRDASVPVMLVHM